MDRRRTKSSAVRSSTEPTVGLQVLRALAAAVEDAGASRADFLRAIELDEAELSATDARLPLRDVLRFCEQALLVSKDPALGLHWGAGLEERDLGPVSLLLAQTSSLRRGLALWSRFERLLHDEPSFEVIEDDPTMTLRVTNLERYPRAVVQFVSELRLAGMLTVIRRFCANARPLVVRFAYAPPAYRDEYDRVFGTAVHFDQPATEMVLESALLDRPSPQGDLDIHAAVLKVAEQRLLRLTCRASHAVRLREYLLAQAPERSAMAEAARALGLSARSLRRQLTSENTSFREVEYAVMELVAQRLLCDQGLTIQEAAHEMGFSDAATFHRAFKTWTGRTPSEFRQRAVAAGG
jgi:AraC-like DNA-binding protein